MFSPCIKFVSPHNNVSSTPSTSDMANSITKDFFTSPALSLSLAGVFRNGNEIEEVEVEAESRGRDETIDISSENTGPLGRSDEDGVGEGVGDEEEEEGEDVDNNKRKRKKRKTYHRHTTQQIREMEELFKDSPHPDEKQRQQLSKQLGLSPQQVKFWFQNRRTQIKAIQERHENSLLKSEMDKIREENRFLRENIKKTCCPNCGFSTMSKDTAIPSEEQKLRIENARLKAEIEKLRGRPGDFLEGTTSPSSSFMAGADQNKNKTSIDAPLGNFGIDKSSILERVNLALDELTKMATANEPLWVNSLESGRQILNYDEYLRAFAHKITRSSRQAKFSVEASRETGIVFLDMSRLIQAFMDVTQWKEMFCCMISKASILDVISEGEGDTQSGLVQLILAELQVLTPTVPTREINFVRYLKQLNHDRWAIVDVTIDMTEDSIDATLVKFRKRPSGCIIEDKGDGHCEVIWVEHMECQKTAIPTMYRSIVNTGLAFGAHHWMETLGLHCERMVFSMATNIPTKDSLGVSTLAGRRSILRLAHRMCANFCHAIGASRNRTWTKVSTRSGDDIRFTSRKNINDLGEPQGAILCAVSSVWLPVSSVALFNFLRDESQRTQWDIMLSGGPTQTIVNLVKGKDRRNSVTVHAVKCTETSRMWVLQDSSTNAYESTVVYAPVGADEMQSVMTGCESTNVAILPSGFSILPDGLESRPLVITSRSNTEEDRGAEGGSLLTVAFQVLVSSSPATKVTQEAVENVNDIVSSTLDCIKRSLGCEDE